MTLITTHSSRTAFQTCQRKFYYAYIKRMRPRRKKDTLLIGDACHNGLEAWFNFRNIPNSKDQLFEALKAAKCTMPDEYTYAKVAQMLIGYHYRWAGERMRVIAVEKKFEYSPKGIFGVICSGKIDAVIEDTVGVHLVEHKTKAGKVDVGAPYWERLTLDGQVSEYYLAARELGYDVRSCIYDVLVKPAAKRLRATPEDKRKYKKTGELYKNQRDRDETVEEYAERIGNEIAAKPNDYYHRSTVVRLPGELERYEANRDAIIRQIMRAMDDNCYPMNTSACDRYNRLCSYFGVCCGTESLDSGRFEKTDEHPELT